MLNLDCTTLSAVVDQAMTDAAQHPRWIAAIERAVRELLSNPYLERQDGHLLIASPSGNVYSANGICQCEAFSFGRPCWHRAAARLVRLHDERQRAGAYTQAADAGLFGPAGADVFHLNLPDDDQYDALAQPRRSVTLAQAQAEIDELFA